MRMGEFSEATHFYSQAIESVSTNPILYNNRAIANVRAEIESHVLWKSLHCLNVKQTHTKYADEVEAV